MGTITTTYYIKYNTKARVAIAINGNKEIIDSIDSALKEMATYILKQRSEGNNLTADIYVDKMIQLIKDNELKYDLIEEEC